MMIADDELLVESAEEFLEWLIDPLTRPGSRACYHRGYLAADKSTGSGEKQARVRAVARAALMAAGYREERDKHGPVLGWNRKRQLVHLFQRRIKGGGFEYIAVRASR